MTTFGLAVAAVYKTYKQVEYKDKEKYFYLAQFIKSSKSNQIKSDMDSYSNFLVSDKNEFDSNKDILEVDGWILSKKEIAKAKLISAN
jgi:phage-related protein